MIQENESEFLNKRNKWVLTRFPNLDLNLTRLQYAMDCADDPLAIEICTDKYARAILAFVCRKDYKTYVDENDGQWLDDPEVMEFFLMDAMYFRTVNPAYRLITNIQVMSTGDIVVEY